VNKPSDLDDWLKQEEPGPDDGLGDDWESAFQAEDSTPPGGADDFFQHPGPSNPYQFTPPAEADLAHLPDLDQELARGTVSRRQPPAAAAVQAEQTETAATRTSIRQSFTKALAALPLLHKLVLGATILAGILMMAVFLLTATAPPQPLKLPGQESRLADESPRDISPGAPGQIESTRRKWDFKPFFLPVAGADTGEKNIFLEVDITLLLVLAPAEEIPQAKKIFIRELIYQYFRQQPLATLRHYSLARGEMNRNLMTWLREQWPEAPVETVIFNRYQLN
jgi:hypothetical protein